MAERPTFREANERKNYNAWNTRFDSPFGPEPETETISREDREQNFIGPSIDEITQSRTGRSFEEFYTNNE